MKRTQDALLQEDTLAFFYHSKLIAGEPMLIKSGKEATVYRCEGHPETGMDYVAVKFYRPHRSRSFKNDSVYREGRDIGGEREARAAARKSRFGREIEFATWIGEEFETLRRLYRAGCDVPEPLSYNDHVILMEFVGDGPAPGIPLHQLRIERDEARSVLDKLLWNVELMLQYHRVHGDLSPYNILYARKAVTIIDFPQAVDPRANGHAGEMLRRDMENLGLYFEGCGVRFDGGRYADDLYRRYVQDRRYSYR